MQVFLLLQKQLDHRHHNLRFLNRQAQGQRLLSILLIPGKAVLSGFEALHLDFAAVMQELRVLDQAAQTIQRQDLEGPHEEMYIQTLGQRIVGESGIGGAVRPSGAWVQPRIARLFRQRFGCSPQIYLQQRRIAIASERLRVTRDSIDDVAASVGFANRFHFTWVFTRLIGVGPATWRRTGQ